MNVCCLLHAGNRGREGYSRTRASWLVAVAEGLVSWVAAANQRPLQHYTGNATAGCPLRMPAHASARILDRVRQLWSKQPRLECSRPGHGCPSTRNQGNMLTSAVSVRVLLQVQVRGAGVQRYRGWRNVAGDVGACAGDGVGKWAAVAVAPTHWDVCRMFVFSDATDWRRRKNGCELAARDQMKRRQLSRALSTALSYR